MDDCQCADGDVVGGLNRIASFVDSLRSLQPQQPFVLLDAGDLFNTYSLPEANQAILALAAAAGYDALNAGDQEFVENAAFWQAQHARFSGKLPFTSANLTFAKEPRFPLVPVVKVVREGIRITVLGLIEPDAFEFIENRDLQVEPPLAVLRSQGQALFEGSDLQILLFHGSWEMARQLVAENPYLDLVIMGHQQRREAVQVGQTLLVENGYAAEFLGSVKLTEKGGEWQAQHQLIPITKNLPVYPFAREIVDHYYQQLNGEPGH